MPTSKTERRSKRRIPIQVPVSVKTSDGQIEQSTKTRDLSTNGVFVYTNAPLVEGSELELVLVLPPEVTFAERRWVCCHASVVRVEESAKGENVGVAAVIKRFQVLPEF
jgi:PilZ domain-containing protein